MHEYIAQHALQAEALSHMTGLRPIAVESPAITGDKVEDVTIRIDSGNLGEWWRVCGVRFFVSPRTISLRAVLYRPREASVPKLSPESLGWRRHDPFRGHDVPVGNPGENLLPAAVDAAAYSLDQPPFPLAVDPAYRGEPMRFVAVDWGLLGTTTELVFRVRAIDAPSLGVVLAGYLVCEPFHVAKGLPYIPMSADAFRNAAKKIEAQAKKRSR